MTPDLDQEVQNSVSLISSNSVVSTLALNFVKASLGRLRLLKREALERARRREPVYDVQFFNLTHWRIKRVTSTKQRRGVFRSAIIGVLKREWSITSAFREQKRLAALNVVEQQEKRVKSFWRGARRSLSLCRSINQYISNNDGGPVELLKRLTNRQMNSSVVVVSPQRHLNRSYVLMHAPRTIRMFEYKWMMGKPAIVHGRICRLLYSLRKRNKIVIKHFQAVQNIWRKLPNSMTVFGRRKQVYGFGRYLRVNVFEQQRGFQLMISSIYRKFRVLTQSTKLVREDKPGRLRSIRLLRLSKLRNPYKLSLRKLRKVKKNRPFLINIVLVSKRSNFHVVFGEQRGKMLIAVSCGNVGFGKKRYRQRKSAGYKLGMLCINVLRFLNLRFKRLKVKMIIHDSLRRNRTAKGVFWNLHHHLVDQYFNRRRQTVSWRSYFGKWFRSLLIETGNELYPYGREEQESIVNDWIGRLAKRGGYAKRVKLIRKLLKYRMIGSLATGCNDVDTRFKKNSRRLLDEVEDNVQQDHYGSQLKQMLELSLALKWRLKMKMIARSWYVRTYNEPNPEFSKFIWRSPAGEREYRLQRQLEFQKRYLNNYVYKHNSGGRRTGFKRPKRHKGRKLNKRNKKKYVLRKK